MTVSQASTANTPGDDNPGDTSAWLLGSYWDSTANDAAGSKFLNDVQEFVSVSKTDVSAVPGLLGISPAMADLHRNATKSLLHLAVLGDRFTALHASHLTYTHLTHISTCALVALAAVNALVGGCAATRYALRFTEVPEFFERPAPHPNSLDIDDIVGHRVYVVAFTLLTLL